MGMNAPSGNVTQWSQLHLQGSDTESFLQGQLTQDVGVSSGEIRYALLLQPDSKIVAFLGLQRDGDGFNLLVAREAADDAAARLKRFMIRVDCKLSEEKVDHGLWRTEEERTALRLPAPRDFAKGFTPHTFGRNFVEKTISFTKGCFTGQELVGRLDARGSSVPFRFVSFEGPNEEEVTRIISSKGPADLASISSLISNDTGVEGLAVVHRTLLGDLDEARLDDVVLKLVP